MARDLKLPADIRKNIQISNIQREKEYIEIKILKNELNVPNPKRDDILKYLLWKECEEICPYTGKSISANQLLEISFIPN